MSLITIGIDVGGTNTDVVLLKDGIKIASAKVETSDDISEGITKAFTVILDKAAVKPEDVRYVKLGTTHLLNATLQNNLSQVAVIRLAFPATTAIPPCTGWPLAIKAKVVGLSAVIDGGYEYNGQLIRPLNPDQLTQIADEIVQKGIHLIAITGVFAHLNSNQEMAAASILKEALTARGVDVKISLSHHMGGLGLLERENATIINSALLSVYEQVCQSLRLSMQICDLTNAVAFLSHNDGTIDPIDEQTDELASTHKPIFTLNAGQTNSLRGAAILAQELGVSDIMIADIGGTSTDIGRLKNGKPTEASALTKIADISLNLQTVEGKSIALGGGSRIELTDGIIKIGPTSVANHLKSLALSFEGNVLTATDIAVCKGRIQDASIKPTTAYPDAEMLDKIDDALHEKLASTLSEVWHSTEDKPMHLILVGGGSKLFDPTILSRKLLEKGCGLSIIQHPDAAVANALGAASGQISGTYTQAFDYQSVSSEQAEDIVKKKANEIAISRGADPGSLYIKFKREDQIDYVVGKPVILTIKVAGDLQRDYFHPKPHQRRDLSPLALAAEHEPRQAQSRRTEMTAMSDDELNTDFCSSDQSTSYSIDIKARAIGCAFLGSGGGGDTRLAELMVQDNNQALPLAILPLENLADDATVISFALVGSPSVIEEKLPSKDEITAGFFALQAKLNKNIDAIVTGEIGGLNGLFAIILVQELAAKGIKVQLLDADCMGRAFPGVNMVTPIMFNTVDSFVAAISSPTGTVVVDGESPKGLETKARALVSQNLGGVGYITFLPMNGKAAKAVCIPGTLSLAKRMGTAYLNAKKNNEGVLKSMNMVLADTDYEKIEEVFAGQIQACPRHESRGFAVGGVVVKNEKGEIAELVFQNENLLVRKRLSHGYYKELECVPNLIVIADKDTLLPISCGQLKYGQNIRILTMKPPKILLTPEAQAFVSREAFQLDKLCQLLNGSKPQTDLFATPNECFEQQDSKTSAVNNDMNQFK